jgi:hypothetical protein
MSLIRQSDGLEKNRIRPVCRESFASAKEMKHNNRMRLEHENGKPILQRY